VFKMHKERLALLPKLGLCVFAKLLVYRGPVADIYAGFFYLLQSTVVFMNIEHHRLPKPMPTSHTY